MVEKRALVEEYGSLGRLADIYLRIKLKICPLLDIEPHFPSEGRVIDLGCGNGLFPLILTLGSSRRKITGFDLDTRKVRVAHRLQDKFPNLAFHVGNIVTMDFPEADVFSLIDVLYLIPFEDQVAVLEKCFRALSPGGHLIIKEMDVRPRWKHLWNTFQETISVRVVGFTLGKKFFFRPREDFRRLLASLGFQVTVVGMHRGYWYPHILYVCRK